jgi:hypothetical protein
MEIKIVNGFAWFVVTEKAKEVFESGLFELYVLYKDGTESSVHDFETIDDAIAVVLYKGLDIAIEGGFINT